MSTSAHFGSLPRGCGVPRKLHELANTVLDIHFRGQLLVEERTKYMDLTSQVRVALM